MLLPASIITLLLKKKIPFQVSGIAQYGKFYNSSKHRE